MEKIRRIVSNAKFAYYINSPMQSMEEYQSDYPLTYISLFSGIGGFEVGILKIFPNAICLGYSEVEPNAIKVYEAHFPDHKNLGDVTKVDGRKFRGKVDLLVGGSPCQNFSAIGDGTGLKGEKSRLLREYLRILDEVRPEHFILENVNMKREHRDAVTKLVGVEPVMIDSNIISFQRRKRLYWCNFDISRISDLPLFKGTLADVLLERDDPLLDEVLWKDLNRKTTGNTEKYLKMVLNGKPCEREKYFNVSYYSDKQTHTLTCCSSQDYVCMGNNITRQFHPVERERLQTFPDDWTNPVATTRRMRALGNAVTCDVIALICSCIN